MAETRTIEAQVGRASSPRKQGFGTVAALELMRGLASLDVFLWHLINYPSGIPRLPGLFRLFGWSRESVIVFFVLSGYVIALSQQRLHRTAIPFFKARVKRIVPIYLIALAAAVAVGWIVRTPCTGWQIFGHLLFLQSFEGSLVSPLPTNGPLWSLGTEFEFYMTLVLILAFRKPALIVVWWSLAIAGLFIRYAGYTGSGVEGLALEFLALSPCWLLGYSFAGLRSRYSLTLTSAVTLFLMIPLVSYSDYGTVLRVAGEFDNLKCLFIALLIAPLIHTLAIRQLYPGTKPVAHGWLIPVVLYFLVAGWAVTHPLPGFRPLPMVVMLAIPVIFFIPAYLILPNKSVWPINTETFRRISIFLGGGSYALYAIHTPILILAAFVLPDSIIRFIGLLAATAASVVFLEYVVQPRISNLIDRIWKFRQTE